MFWNRWHLAWLACCVLVASAGAFFILFMLIVEGPPMPYDTPPDLVRFLLTFYTLPVVTFYLGGLVVGWTLRRISRAFTRPRSRARAAWFSRPMAAAKR
jgi:hypothetical protein